MIQHHLVHAVILKFQYCGINLAVFLEPLKLLRLCIREKVTF
jgi:hypothetical protein